jgi:hypothetical protein
MEETGGRKELGVRLTRRQAQVGEPPLSGSSAGPISGLHISLYRTLFLEIVTPLEGLFNILHIRIKNY